MATTAKNAGTAHSLHILGVMSGLAAGAWLGGAEAPTKLVTIGLSPFVISLAMVAGVFVARWTLPTVLKGTGYVWVDLRARPHLIVWAVIAGALWAVANTLTVFAIRDVGISVAFPLWNCNGLVGLFWGWLLFNELRGATGKVWLKVLGGSLAIVVGACLLAYATTAGAGGVHTAARAGIAAALGAGLLWGTMYIPYRKAYISGMNPLSFVTIFTVGELVTMTVLALFFHRGRASLLAELTKARPALFWLFLGGFCWVLGDLFQQYAAKYIGIGRGIPLSNTNQLWGLAWGALVFGELVGRGLSVQTMVVIGSLIMILGALAISFGEAPMTEHASWRRAMQRECERYGLDTAEVESSLTGEDPINARAGARRWWDVLIVAAAVAVFIWLGSWAKRPLIAMNATWSGILIVVMIGFLIVCGVQLWKRTRFS